MLQFYLLLKFLIYRSSLKVFYIVISNNFVFLLIFKSRSFIDLISISSEFFKYLVSRLISFGSIFTQKQFLYSCLSMCSSFKCSHCCFLSVHNFRDFLLYLDIKLFQIFVVLQYHKTKMSETEKITCYKIYELTQQCKFSHFENFFHMILN